MAGAWLSERWQQLAGDWGAGERQQRSDSSRGKGAVVPTEQCPGKAGLIGGLCETPPAPKPTPGSLLQHLGGKEEAAGGPV